MAASRIDGTNWKLALQKYVHNHNTLVPHARLGITPFELMVGWKYRGTFPSLWGPTGSRDLDRVDLRERDAEAKLTSKKYADKVNHARDSNISIGDSVLLSQLKKCKSDPTFSSERFKVVARHGAKVVIISDNGVQYTRNVQDVKLAPPYFEELEAATDSPDYDAANDSDPILDNATGTSVNDQGELESRPGVDGAPPSVPGRLRERIGIKKPARFDNRFVYNVFN